MRNQSIFFRRTTCFLINKTFNHKPLFLFVGWLNRKLPFLETVYLGYSADPAYINHYASPNSGYVQKGKWSPFLAGIFKQNGKWGLKFFVSSTEEEFVGRENKDNLKLLAEHLEKIRQTTGASQKTFAGILPGVLYKNRIIHTMEESEVAVATVCKAISIVRELEHYPENVPLIILGGKGFIGRRVIKNLAGREVYCVDKDGEDHVSSSWPEHLTGQKAILINISRKFVLSHYIPYIWDSLVLLNEVYPEPSQEEVQAFTAKGGAIYHIAGIEGKSYPSFPNAYANAIPCSAAWKSDNMQVVLKKLSH